ncbi:MAG TPA: hypothetical protein PLQ35_17370 [bacterium]|nr:hypothetical protein [bacterium]HQL64048.1 hypothetical protein [bacterium]
MATRQDDLCKRLDEYDRRLFLLKAEQRLLESEKRELILATDGELRRYELSALERRANAPVKSAHRGTGAREELARMNTAMRERDAALARRERETRF